MKYIEKNNIIINIIEVNTFTKKLIGLMFKKEPIKEGYLFNKVNGIHTFFMRQNIDVIYLNKDLKVLYIKENMHPYKILLPKKNVCYTLELPMHKSNDFIVGETLTIKEK